MPRFVGAFLVAVSLRPQPLQHMEPPLVRRGIVDHVPGHFYPGMAEEWRRPVTNHHFSRNPVAAHHARRHDRTLQTADRLPVKRSHRHESVANPSYCLGTERQIGPCPPARSTYSPEPATSEQNI